MARIRALDRPDAPEAARPMFDAQVARHGRMTNMKRTLAHSPVALASLMTWYDLRDEIVPFLGERTTHIFAHAISSQSDCLICSTFFRRILMDSGEDPDRLALDERERLLVEYGGQLCRDANQVSDELFERLEQHFSPSQIVALTAFGGLMIATNVFNNALRVDLDEYLASYRKPNAGPKT